MPDSAPTGVFFFHNPKAGGTAVASALAGRFPEADRAPLIENHAHDHAALAGDYGAFAGYRYYGGHYGRDVFDAVGSHLAPVTNVRHPVERIVSLYNYYRLQVDLPEDEATRRILHPVVVAQGTDLHGFVTSEDPAVRVHTCDFHARQLTSTPWDVEAPADLAAATALLDAMPWIYVCDEPEASMRWARDVFGADLAAIGRENVTVSSRDGERAVTEVPARTRAAIEERNRLDAALHERARERLREASARPRRRWWRGRRR